MHNLIRWCRGGKGVMGPGKLQVFTHLCGNRLRLDIGILVRPSGLLLFSNVHLSCDNEPGLPSFWASVSLSVRERD